MKKFILKINEHQRLELININAAKNHICKYDEIAIIFVNDKKRYTLYQDIILTDLEVFRDILTGVLSNKFEINPLIESDLGLYWNQYLHDLSTKEKTNKMDITKYLLWCSSPQRAYSTWIYNKDDSIILEINPDYPWHLIDPEDVQRFIPYDEWMKNYKPIFCGKIDKTIIQEWIFQIDRILIEMSKGLAEHKQS